MRPLWASSILRVSWKSSTIGKCPRCEAGRTVGTGALRFSSRSTTGGGVSTRAARHMWGFGRFGRSLRGGGNGRVPCSNLDTGETETSPREERGRHGRERETPNDAGGVLRAVYPRTTRRRGVLYVAHGRLHGADANGGDDGRLGSSHTRGWGDRALQVAAI